MPRPTIPRRIERDSDGSCVRRTGHPPFSPPPRLQDATPCRIPNPATPNASRPRITRPRCRSRFVRASLGARTVAYLLDILFIFGFTALLTLLITVIGVVTFGLGWTLFAISAGERGHLQRHHGGRLQAEHDRAAPDGAAGRGPGARRVGRFITAAVHALVVLRRGLDLLLWCLDLAFGLMRSDRRLGHDLLLGLAVVHAR